VAALPQLQERKRLLDMHMNLATALLRAIKERNLDEFHGVEDTIARQVRSHVTASSVPVWRGSFPLTAAAPNLLPVAPQTPATVLAILNDPSKGTPDDKLRLFLVYLLSTQEIPAADLAAMETALQAAGCNLAAVDFAKRDARARGRAAPRPCHRLTSRPSQATQGAAPLGAGIRRCH